MNERMTKQRARNNPITRDVNAVERVNMALQLRKKRLTYQEIADRCGYGSAQAAHKAVMREMQRCVSEKVEDYRKQELDILDEIHQKVWIEAFETEDKDGNIKTNLWAVDRLLELSRDRRKLLNLDVQPEQELTNQNYIKEIVLVDVIGDSDATS